MEKIMKTIYTLEKDDNSNENNQKFKKNLQSKMNTKFYYYTALFLSILNFFHCGKIGVSNNEDSLSLAFLLNHKLQKATLNGKAMKGEVMFGSVKIYPLSSNGQCDTSVELANTNTDAEGNYSITFLRTGGSVCLKVKGDPRGISRVRDEKSGKELPLNGDSSFELTNIINESSISGTNRNNSLVSPFSSMMSKRIMGKTKEYGGKLSSSDLERVVRSSGKEVVIRFGLNRGFGGKSISASRIQRALNDSDFPNLDDIKIDFKDTENPITQNFNLLNAAFSTLGSANKKGNDVNTDDIGSVIDAFSSDMEDGIPDGKELMVNLYLSIQIRWVPIQLVVEEIQQILL
jgi:hypothetical protein